MDKNLKKKVDPPVPMTKVCLQIYTAKKNTDH